MEMKISTDEPSRTGCENFAMLLSAVPDFTRWSPAEKRDLAAIIRAKSGHDEMRYLHLLQCHHSLRAAVLELGSKAL